MNPCELAAIVNALAVTISNKFDDDELSVLSAVLVQLGDTLATIAAQRNLISNSCKKPEK